jgi:hypothetical protein
LRSSSKKKFSQPKPETFGDEDICLDVKRTDKVLRPEPLVKQSTASTVNRHFDIKEEVEDCESVYNNESEYSYSQRNGSSRRKDPSVEDPMWEFYPKQVQNVLKKKRIDRERLRKSLKPPGKRNYRTLFSNLKKVSESEVSTSSLMFKGMKDEYYKLIHAEKKVYKALQEKGLFLDKQDFNIMEVFNYPCSEYSDYEEEKSVQKPKRRFGSIYVEEFESTSAKTKPRQMESNEDLRPQAKASPSEESRASNKENLSLPDSGTPSSFTIEKMSLLSKNTFKSIRSNRSKNSHRLLFPDCHVERRERMVQMKPAKKDFLCTCNKNNFQDFFHPIIEIPVARIHPYVLSSDNDSIEEILEDHELMRSMSVPAHNHPDSEDKLIEPLVLERQPFSNVMNFSKPTNNYANPLEKLDFKQVLNNDNS